MWEMIRGYLTFTRKERIGVLFLLIVIVVLFVLPLLFRPAIGKPDAATTEKMKKAIQHFEAVENDSFGNADRDNRYAGAGNRQLFFFDPNNLTAEDWKKLGLSDHLIHTILNYQDKGGRFRRREDLKKLYGLHETDYQRLFPYIRIPEQQQRFERFSIKSAKRSYDFPVKSRIDSFAGFRRMNLMYPVKKFSVTDINVADSSRWAQLPGIGEKLASRIVHFREKLGGFYNIEQVGETFGLPDSTFQKIRPYLVLGAVNLTHVNLNTASKETLQAHPYIRWQIANGIIAYRLQHGGFHTVDELMQLAQVDSAKFERLKPYLEVGADQDRQ